MTTHRTPQKLVGGTKTTVVPSPDTDKAMKGCGVYAAKKDIWMSVDLGDLPADAASSGGELDGARFQPDRFGVTPCAQR